MSPTRVAVAGVTLTSALVLFVVFMKYEKPRGESSAKPEEPTVTVPASRREKRESGTVQALLASIDARLRALEEPHPAEPSESEQGRPARVPDPPEQTAEMIKTQRKEAIERLQEIDQKMEIEARDNSWATGAEAEITTLFSQGSYGKTRLTGVSCRSSVCRIEAAHEDQDSSMAFEQIRRGIPGDFHMQHIDPEDDGTRRTVAYFVRPGHVQESPLYDMMYGQRP